jgi:hypothetical protein
MSAREASSICVGGKVPGWGRFLENGCRSEIYINMTEGLACTASLPLERVRDRGCLLDWDPLGGYRLRRNARVLVRAGVGDAFLVFTVGNRSRR